MVYGVLMSCKGQAHTSCDAIGTGQHISPVMVRGASTIAQATHNMATACVLAATRHAHYIPVCGIGDGSVADVHVGTCADLCIWN